MIFQNETFLANEKKAKLSGMAVTHKIDKSLGSAKF